MKKLKGLLLGIMTVCCTVGFAACGGDDSETSSDTPREICGERAYHNYIDGKCDNCEKEVTPTEYFTFSGAIVDEKLGYAISGVTGDLPANVVLPDYYNKIAINSIAGSAFAYQSMVSIKIPNNVNLIDDSAFLSCYNLTSVTIPDSITSIGAHAFFGCSNLSYNEYKNGFYLGNNKNPYLVLISGYEKTTIHKKTKIISYNAFMNSNLSSITLPDGLITIGESAFANCSGLTSITIPDSVSLIEDAAFSGCVSLKNITIPSSVTLIGSYAFNGCGGLTSITIPKGVTLIGVSAFEYCRNLTTVYYHGTAQEWNKISIDDYNTYLTKATRYYYSESKPTESGNYWHYNRKGQIVVWE